VIPISRAKPRKSWKRLTPDPLRPLDSVVVEMSVSRKNYVDLDRWKLVQEPLWVLARRIVPPRIGEDRQTVGRCDLECVVPVELDLDIA